MEYILFLTDKEGRIVYELEVDTENYPQYSLLKYAAFRALRDQKDSKGKPLYKTELKEK